MDPNEALRRARALAREAREILEHKAAKGPGPSTADDESEVLDKLESVGELFLALDAWLVNGGFLPDDWKQETGGSHQDCCGY